MPKAAQWTEEQSWSEHEKEFGAVSLFPVCECPNLDEPDYLGTKRYTAESHPTQHCMAEDSTGWQRQVTAGGFCATEYQTFYLMVVLVRQKQDNGFLQEVSVRAMMSLPM